MKTFLILMAIVFVAIGGSWISGRYSRETLSAADAAVLTGSNFVKGMCGINEDGS